MRRGEIWRFERDRPTGEDDVRTPYRVVVTATYRITDDQPWVLAAPIETRQPDTMVTVRLTDDDPIPGWIRVDKMASTYRRWLTGPYGELATDTLELLSTSIRTELDL